MGYEMEGIGLFDRDEFQLVVRMFVPLVINLGGVLRSEAMNGRYRGYEALRFVDGLGEPLKLAEVDAWMAEHSFSRDGAQ